MRRGYDNNVVKIIRQVCFFAPHEIDRLTNRPEIRNGHRFPPHQSPSGIFRITQPLFIQNPVFRRNRLQDFALVFLVQIFQEIDNVIGIQIPDDVCQHGIGQFIDNILADRFIDIGEDVGIQFIAQRMDDRQAVIRRQAFQQIRQVSGMQRHHQFTDSIRRRAFIDRSLDGLYSLIR